MNPETQRLIDLSVKDDRITERQREIILKKAAMLGDDVDEVEFILAGYTIIPTIKVESTTDSVSNKSIPAEQGETGNSNVVKNVQQVEREKANHKEKDKTIAGLLGIFLGGFGAHKFYLGKTGVGIVYLLFCWSYIPFIIGLIEGISYLCKSEEEFTAQYL